MQACLKNSKIDTVILHKAKRQKVQKGTNAASGVFWEDEKLIFKTMLNLFWIRSYQ